MPAQRPHRGLSSVPREMSPHWLPPTLHPANLLVMAAWVLCLLKVTIAAIWSAGGANRPPARHPGTCDRVAAASAVVTGASSGLGLATAEALAARGLTVVMACKSVSRGTAAARGIRRRVPHAKLEVWGLDLGRADSVLGFSAALVAAACGSCSGAAATGPAIPPSSIGAEEFLDAVADHARLKPRHEAPERVVVDEEEGPGNATATALANLGDMGMKGRRHRLPPLSILVNCAAVLPGQPPPHDATTGTSSALTINATAQVALAMCLLPALLYSTSSASAKGQRASSGTAPHPTTPRIVTVGSFTHHAAELRSALAALRADPEAAPAPFRPAKEYMESKLLLTMAMRHLHTALGRDLGGGDDGDDDDDAFLTMSGSSGGGTTVHHRRLAEALTVDPGAIDSNLVRHWPTWLQWVFRGVLSLLGMLNSPEDAAAAMEAACLSCSSSRGGGMDDDGEEEGKHQHWFNLSSRSVPLPPSQTARSPDNCEEVWIRSRAAALEFLRGDRCTP